MVLHAASNSSVFLSGHSSSDRYFGAALLLHSRRDTTQPQPVASGFPRYEPAGCGERSPPLGVQYCPFGSSCCCFSGIRTPREQGCLLHTCSLTHGRVLIYSRCATGFLECFLKVFSQPLPSSSLLLSHSEHHYPRMCACKCHSVRMNNRQKFFLTFHHVGPRYGTQVRTLGSRYFHSLGYLTGQWEE